MSIEIKHYQPDIFPKEQIAKWEQGAKNFKSFWGELDEETKNYYSRFVGPLQAVFLGEKPAVFYSPPSHDHQKRLGLYGLESTSKYIYDPKLISKIATDYPTEFSRHNLNTPKDVMDFLNEADPGEHSTIRGLVLGFPYEAVKNYAIQNSFRINDIAIRLYELLNKNPADQNYLELNYFTEKIDGNADLIPFFRKQLTIYKSELGINDSEIV